MQLLDFIEAASLSQSSERDRASLLCYYQYKETGCTSFSMSEISDLLLAAGFNAPNISRLRTNLTNGRGRVLLPIKGDSGRFWFVPVTLQTLERDYGHLWEDTVTVPSNSELLEEAKFCGKRPFIDTLIRQINFTYGHNCYDACAVLLRRLFEVLLVLSYQHLGLENDITNAQGNHLMLEGIVKDAVQNRKLGIPSRLSKHYDEFREIGNYSAHSITYTAGRKDIDDIKINYRAMLEDLYYRPG